MSKINELSQVFYDLEHADACAFRAWVTAYESTDANVKRRGHARRRYWDGKADRAWELLSEVEQQAARVLLPLARAVS